MALKSEDKRISIIVGLILVTLTLVSGISVYGLMQRKAQSILSKNLEVSLLNNVHLFEDRIDRGIDETHLVTTRFLVINSLKYYPATKTDHAKSSALHLIAQTLLQSGFRGVSFYTADGREVARAGRFSKSPAMRIPLSAPTPTSLLWDRQYLLQVRMDVQDTQGKPIGRVLTEKPMPQLTQAFSAVHELVGKSGELAVCAPLQQDMQCFPTTLHPNEILGRLPLVIDGQMLPMAYALQGKTGIITALDYRRERVVAAYAPIGSLGMGMVLKIDRSELYGPLTEQWKFIAPLLTALVLAGMLLMRWLLTPLVRTLVVAKQETMAANSKLQLEIAERKMAEKQMLHLANYDALTGLPNRNLLQDRFQQVLAHVRRNQLKTAVLFIDLDQFKTINDTLGHNVGDILLWSVADRLVSAVRQEDTVARQGGDEFILLLHHIDGVDDANHVGQKILGVLTQPYPINESMLYVSASIGIAIFPDDGEDVDTLLKNSDTAMYHAKESGRNNYQFFAPAMNQLAMEKQALGTDLHHALERNEMLLHFQPVIDIVSGELTGMEVLLRWQHPERGMISPVKFIPLAEDTGLIVPIGEWVLMTACEQLKSWHDQGYDVPSLAINLSAKQFRKNTLASTIARILEMSGVEARYITLEITESVFMENTDEVAGMLRKLSGMGLAISIDDFGTGYSSLSYLKRFPIDNLKIDRSFVMDIVTDPDDAAIVTAIIALAHSLQMKVIAEGVETAEQLAFLRQQNCGQYQGYYFSKPLPASEIVSKLRRR